MPVGGGSGGRSPPDVDNSFSKSSPIFFSAVCITVDWCRNLSYLTIDVCDYNYNFVTVLLRLCDPRLEKS